MPLISTIIFQGGNMKITIHCSKCGEQLYDKFGSKSCELSFADYILPMECRACGRTQEVEINIGLGTHRDYEKE